MKSNKMKYIKAVIIAVFVFLLFAVPFWALDEETKVLDDSVRSSADGEFIALSEGVVHYELGGPENGQTVVLVHGFSVPYYVWDPTFKMLTRAGYRVLRFDLYGRGYSERPDVDHTLELFVNQLTELTEKLELSAPFHLVGLSMGGPIVAAYTNRHPMRVRGLVLVDPLTEPLDFWRVFPSRVPLVGEYVMGVYVMPFLLPANKEKDFFEPEKFPDWVSRFKVQMQYKGYRRAILSTLRHIMRDVDPVAEYMAVGKQRRPVLMFRGDEDHTITAAHIKKIQRIMPTVEFREIVDAGHVPHYERPEKVNPFIIDFFRRVELKRHF